MDEVEVIVPGDDRFKHAPLPTTLEEWQRRKANAELFLREFGEEHRMCPRCLCCDMETVECEACGGEGYTEPGLLYDMDPLWYDQDSTEPCSMCGGKPRWKICLGRCDRVSSPANDAKEESG